MPITLRTYASGDTDYIAKLNYNAATVQAAINALEVLGGGGGGGDSASVNAFFYNLFGGTTTLIGPNSFKPAISGTTLIVAAGGAYLASLGTVVNSLAPQTLTFAGQPAGTYYVNVNSLGGVTRDLAAAEEVYSVYWSGTALSSLTRIAPAIFDGTEANAARISTALATTYLTLDARLEASELQLIATAALAAEAANNAAEALAQLYDLVAGEGGSLSRIRKVGLSLDGGGGVLTTGVKGAIQVDFEGVIIGWNIVADQVGSITIEVDRQASGIPPIAPSMPDTTTDKISASAPIVMTSAQSAAIGMAGVSTWATDIDKWDVLQFNVTAVTTLTKATLYLRVQEGVATTEEPP